MIQVSPKPSAVPKATPATPSTAMAATPMGTRPSVAPVDTPRRILLTAKAAQTSKAPAMAQPVHAKAAQTSKAAQAPKAHVAQPVHAKNAGAAFARRKRRKVLAMAVESGERSFGEDEDAVKKNKLIEQGRKVGGEAGRVAGLATDGRRSLGLAWPVARAAYPREVFDELVAYGNALYIQVNIAPRDREYSPGESLVLIGWEGSENRA